MPSFQFIVLSVLVLVCSFVYAAPAPSFSHKQDEYYMLIALELAKKNPRAPFAALIVDNTTGKILASGLNASKLNPTFHGEIVAINHFAQKYQPKHWKNVTLYTTAEPCAMCQSAIVWAGIERVVFATSIEYLSQHGWDQIQIPAVEVIRQSPFYKGTLTGGVLADKTNSMFNR